MIFGVLLVYQINKTGEITSIPRDHILNDHLSNYFKLLLSNKGKSNSFPLSRNHQQRGRLSTVCQQAYK